MPNVYLDLLTLEEGLLLPLKTYSHQELLEVIDSVLKEHAQKMRLQVEQLGGTVAIPMTREHLRESALGSKLLHLVFYLEQPTSTESEKNQSREDLQVVLMALYGRPYLSPAEEGTQFGELVNSVRIKGTRLPEVMNVNETLHYLNHHAGPRKYYLHDVYLFIETNRLWPIRIRPEGSREKRRYERRAVMELAEQLRSEQQQERQEEE